MIMNIEDARLYCKNLILHPEGERCLVKGEILSSILLAQAIVDLENTEWFCVKCDADKAVELRDTYSQIKPAWHMNKRYWNMMDIEHMDGALVRELIDHSYEEVLKKLPKKIRLKYGM